MILGVDVGGTFTDAVVVAGGKIYTAKTPTTAEDQSAGVMQAISAVLKSSGREPAAVTHFSHGMTVATNALLEGKTATTALVATEGFTDLIELGRQARPELYRLCVGRPAPLVPPQLRIAARERTAPEGVVTPLTDEELENIGAAVAEARVEAVAVLLLHSYRHPEHEQRIGKVLRKRLPDVHVSLSHEVVGTFREFDRGATTEIDAALSPLLDRYLHRLTQSCAEIELREPTIMQSNGGLADVKFASSHAAWTLLSGPAGGVAGAILAGAAEGELDLLSFDMGGTSCDVCAIEDGRAHESATQTVAGRPLALPMLDIHTVGAGGGSIAWLDPGGALRVGPQSAGARPGPAAYGNGGTEPTVTDANVLLGHLPSAGELAGGIEIGREAAERAVTTLAEHAGLMPLECAQGILRVANVEMAQALRAVTVERGIDPRRFTLVAFGGAGPMHAAAVAELLGIERVLCPRTCGVLSALGLATSQRRRDRARSIIRPLSELSDSELRTLLDDLATQALTQLAEREPTVSFTFELRYRGQAFELPVQLEGDPTTAALRAAFEAAHEQRYRYRNTDAEVELVTVRAQATAAAEQIELTEVNGRQLTEHSGEAVFDGESVPTTLVTGEPPNGYNSDRPTIYALAEATVIVPPGWCSEVSERGTIVLERKGPKR